MRYALGDIVLDLGTRQLMGPDGPVHVEPQVLDVLTLLVENRHRAMAKTEILESVWGDQFVSESALTSRIRAARVAIGDDGRAQAMIRTAHGFGYQYVGPVEQEDEPTTRPPDGSGRPDAVLVERHGRGVPLPYFGNPFRGRSTECEEVGTLLHEHRLVTLVGPGGTGKTRLAVEASSAVGCTSGDVASERGLPAVFVDLATVRRDSDVAALLCESIGIRARDQEEVDAAADFLHAVPHLVVLDNCEHVLTTAAAAAERITRAAPDTRILATSREPLGIAGERIYRLGPLPLLGSGDVLTPDQVESNPAAGLFIDRVRQTDRTFAGTAREARQVVELVRALDGLPLAIELAAGRVETFGLDELISRLDQRLDLLRDRGSGRDERHRTLRALVQWSFDALGTDHQRLLCALSVLPAGATLDAIEWLADDLGCSEPGFDLAADLVDASLLQRVEAPSGRRFVQLETLRAFGLDRLAEDGELDAARDRAARWLTGLTSKLRPALITPEEPVWVDRIQREFANIREAHAHVVATGQWEDALAYAINMNSWARMRDAAEVWSWTGDLMEHFCDGPDPERGRCLVLLAQAEWRNGRIEEAAAASRRALEATDDDWTVGHAHAELGVPRLFSGDFEGAVESWRIAMTHLDDAVSPCSAAIAAAYAGQHGVAHEFLVAGEAVAARTRNPSWQAWTRYARAEITVARESQRDASYVPGDEEVRLLQDAIEAADSVQASFIMGVAGVTLAGALADRGETRRAAQQYYDLIERWLRSGSWTQMWTTLRRSAELLADTAPHTALTIIEAATADPTSPALASEAQEAEAELRNRLLAAGATAAQPLPDRGRLTEQARSALSELAAS